MQEKLIEVVRSGQPAHSALARTLTDRIRAGTATPEDLAAAGALIDAYLNDPYLIRYP